MTRTPIVRVRELEVKERAWPLLVAIGYSAVVHMSRTNGILRADNERHRNVNDEFYIITACGRALRWTVTRDRIPENDTDLCARCGIRTDFEALQVEHDEKWKEHQRVEELAEEVRAEARQLERDRKTAVLEALYQAFDWDHVVGTSWSPKTGETDRGQQVIYLQLNTQLRGPICVGDGCNYAYPQLYRAVVHLELIPEKDK